MTTYELMGRAASTLGFRRIKRMSLHSKRPITIKFFAEQYALFGLLFKSKESSLNL